MHLTFDQNITHDFQEASRREWLETNGLGGWASSTISGAHTRRYHGLLVAATQPPVGRMVLLSKLDETVQINGQRFALSSNQYPEVVHPQGFQYLQRFEKDLFPEFEYHAGDVVLRKTIVAFDGENTTLILYEVLNAPQAFSFDLQPLVAFRDYHSLTHANDVIRREGRFHNGIFQVQPYDGVPELFIAVPGASFEAAPDWYYHVEYPLEKYRGLDFHEDLFTYGTFTLRLDSESKVGIIISTEDPQGREAFALYHQEKNRRQTFLANLPVQDDFSSTLALAADQFLVKRGEDLRSIIAGYPWFTDWGRDAMIALPGITLVTGRFEDAKKILRAFAEHVSQGMLPNRFPDANEQPEYNTVDATLWFFIAIYKYLQYTNDEQCVRDELMPVLQDIIDWHDRGTRYNIHTTEDGLLYAGEPGVQLTWMDVKIDEWVVTPRQGFAVEINALWYNVLKIYAEFLRTFGKDTEALQFEERAKQTKQRFNEVFWSEERQYLYDYVDGNHRDTDLRPNQILALSLPFSILPKEREHAVLQAVEEHLLTPVGLRSLAANHLAYQPHYRGGQFSRDSSYHQGTVWGWLLGPFISALIRVRETKGIIEAKKILQGVSPQFSEAGIGTISEIFDADPPHTSRGTIAQAWSVAEILRAYVEDILGKNTTQTL